MYKYQSIQFFAALTIAVTLICSPALASQEDADAAFAEGNWASAAAEYIGLIEEDDQNANNWFNLARSYHQMERFPAARDAYVKALNAGYQPPARANFFLARALMSLNERADALKALEEMASTGGPNWRAVESTQEFLPLKAAPRFLAVLEALKPCNTPEHRAFDFWLGEWDVTSAGAAQATATNQISQVHDGCVLRENYTAGFFTGMSINFYDGVTEKWHQTWISNAGGALYIEGGPNEDGAMVMTDADLPISAASGTVNRLTWTPNVDGSVRQYWQQSTDDGATWSVAFDGVYTKKASE